jgi:D-glycero-D-manno-heptose 1,7-bisphosphate phosphatase
MMQRACVFLDRDGTINVERGYVTDPDQIQLIEGSAEAIRMLNRAGLLAVVLSNQSGVARGLMTEEDLARVTRRLEQLLLDDGAALDAIYYCPHLPTGKIRRYAKDCSCRKPATGMIALAASDLRVDVSKSYMIGDQATDIVLANRAGMPGILVETGRAPDQAEREAARHGRIARTVGDLKEAVQWILKRERLLEEK